jgi:hypothetical protein
MRTGLFRTRYQFTIFALGAAFGQDLRHQTSLIRSLPQPHAGQRAAARSLSAQLPRPA